MVFLGIKPVWRKYHSQRTKSCFCSLFQKQTIRYNGKQEGEHVYKGKVAVRKIVEFILRRGDIDSRKVSNHTAKKAPGSIANYKKRQGMGIKKKSSSNEKAKLRKMPSLSKDVPMVSFLMLPLILG